MDYLYTRQKEETIYLYHQILLKTKKIDPDRRTINNLFMLFYKLNKCDEVDKPSQVHGYLHEISFNISKVKALTLLWLSFCISPTNTWLYITALQVPFMSLCTC